MNSIIKLRTGFTLIELLVVIVIIGMLVAIGLPQVTKARVKAKEAQCLANFRIVHESVERFGVDHNGFYPYRILWYRNDTVPEPDQVSQIQDWMPMGLVGGAQVVNSDGTINQDAFQSQQPRIGADLPRYFNQYSDPLAALGYIPGGDYPKNPFLNRPMAMINWAWSDNPNDRFEPAPNVFVSPGDIVYTFFPKWNGTAWDEPQGVIRNQVELYSIQTGPNQFLNGYYGLDLVDSYQMWVYGNLPTNGIWYSAYENSELVGPPKRAVEIRDDFNGNGRKDTFEAGIIFYASGGTGADARDMSTGGKIEF